MEAGQHGNSRFRLGFDHTPQKTDRIFRRFDAKAYHSSRCGSSASPLAIAARNAWRATTGMDANAASETSTVPQYPASIAATALP
jgi:hypothetical protein